MHFKHLVPSRPCNLGRLWLSRGIPWDFGTSTFSLFIFYFLTGDAIWPGQSHLYCHVLPFYPDGLYSLQLYVKSNQSSLKLLLVRCFVTITRRADRTTLLQTFLVKVSWLPSTCHCLVLLTYLQCLVLNAVTTCDGLEKKTSHRLETLVPSWWDCCGLFTWYNLAGRSVSQQTGFKVILPHPTCFVLAFGDVNYHAYSLFLYGLTMIDSYSSGSLSSS